MDKVGNSDGARDFAKALVTFLLLPCLVISLASWGEPLAAEEVDGAALGGLPTHLPPIKLKDQHGKEWDLHAEKEAKAVVLYTHGIGCPIVRLSSPILEEIKAEYAPKGVEFFMLNANPYDTAADVIADAKEFSITMPILLDATQETARALKIERTCTVIVAAPGEDFEIVYRGAVNDRFDYLAQKPQAKEEWLRDALDAVLAGEEVKVSQTQPKGCLINYLEEK